MSDLMACNVLNQSEKIEADCWSSEESKRNFLTNIFLLSNKGDKC